MRSSSRALAIIVGAALTVGSVAAAVAQEPAAAEPSDLGIDMVSRDRLALQPLAGKAYDKAVAKAAPEAVRYLMATAGSDTAERIVTLSQLAREMEEAGHSAAAYALIDYATLLYRGAWTSAKSDPSSLNADLQARIDAGDDTAGDPAITLWADGEGDLWQFADLCLWPEGDWSRIEADDLTDCENRKGRRVRADSSLLVDPPEVWFEMFNGIRTDIGGAGIHLVVQDKTADDALAGKKLKKAMAKTLKQRAPAVAAFYASGSGKGQLQGVVDTVTLARAADEAGNKKAAKAFMDLALAAYRAEVPEPGATRDLNAELAALADPDGAGTPGMQVYAPDGYVDACFDRQGQFMFCVDGNTPWECETHGGRATRMTLEETNDCEG